MSAGVSCILLLALVFFLLDGGLGGSGVPGVSSGCCGVLLRLMDDSPRADIGVIVLAVSAGDTSGGGVCCDNGSGGGGGVEFAQLLCAAAAPFFMVVIVGASTSILISHSALRVRCLAVYILLPAVRWLRITGTPACSISLIIMSPSL